ncbi:MAG: hypothetical protein ABSA93_06625 [Streptosporangiaceae bacterium]
MIWRSSLNPVMGELEQVQTELGTLSPDSVGDLDERLAVRARIFALRDELEPLQQRVTARQRAVDEARELVRAYEKDQLPMAQAELARATEALVEPPLNDFARLAELAPMATAMRGIRVGTSLVNPSNIRTPRGCSVRSCTR